MAVIPMKALLEAGVQFGHQINRWNPKMAPYIYTKRAGTHIIDLQKTSDLIDQAYAVFKEIGAEGGKVLFVGTKKQAQEVIKEEALRAGQFYVNVRWLGGTLTNFKTIKKSIKKYEDFKQMEADGTFDALTKKEVNDIKKKMARLEKFLGGILAMNEQPKALFVVDPKEERTAILEAKRLHIPVFGIVDTNCDPDDVDYVIPANDDAIRSLKLIIAKMADALIEGAGGVVESLEVTETQEEIEQVIVEMVNVDENVVKQQKSKKVQEALAEEAKVETAPVVEEAPQQEKKDLSSLKADELRAMAKDKGITGYSKMKKEDLIKRLSE